MMADDAPDHFSWEEIYSLYGIPIVEIPIRREMSVVRDPIDDEPSSPGAVGISPSPLTTPIEAFSN